MLLLLAVQPKLQFHKPLTQTESRVPHKAHAKLSACTRSETSKCIIHLLPGLQPSLLLGRQNHHHNQFTHSTSHIPKAGGLKFGFHGKTCQIRNSTKLPEGPGKFSEPAVQWRTADVISYDDPMHTDREITACPRDR